LEQKRPLTIFEKLIVPRRLPYWCFWPLVGLTVYAFGEFLFWITSEPTSYLWVRVHIGIFSFTTSAIPMTHISIADNFYNITQRTLMPLAENREKMKCLINTAYRITFTTLTRGSVLVVLLITISASITIINQGIPFASTVLNNLALLAFIIIASFCGKALYVTIAMLYWLRRLVRQPMASTFFLINSEGISDLQWLYFRLGFLITLLYTLLGVAVWAGPYGFNPLLLGWLTALALYPISLFIVSVILIHRMIKVLKAKQIIAVSRLVDDISKRILCNDSLNNISLSDTLLTLMDIQARLQGMKEWPIGIPGFLPFLVPPLVQIILIIMR